MAYLESDLHSFMLKQSYYFYVKAKLLLLSYYLEVRDQWVPQDVLLLSKWQMALVNF